MKKYFDVLKFVPLFKGIEENELNSLLQCLSAKIATFNSGETIFKEGDSAKFVGIVLSGEVQILKDDFYGNRNIVASADQGHLFAESFACADVNVLPINVIAKEDCDIMLIDYNRIITTCPNSCLFHSKLIFNMMKILATKNVALNQKIELASKRTTREKLITYLSTEAKKAGNNSFTIPFNRQELADFLFVDRSAMSSELCKLRDEEIIEFSKNKFKLL